MSTIQALHENRTELHLDYKDLAAGPVIIVIDGLPTAEHGAYTAGAGGLHPASPSGPKWRRGNESPPSPLTEEAEAIAEATGYVSALFTPLLLAAWRGKEALTLELIAAMIEDAPAEDKGKATALAEYARAILYNGLGRYADAVDGAKRAYMEDDAGSFSWALLELAEAGARCDSHACARDALGRLDARAGVDDDWQRGVRARSAALLSEGRAAEALYREALEEFERRGSEAQLARTQLVYGEWLRRENRRVDAREQLRPAHDTFSCAGAEAFAERARRELLATGETARRRADDTRGALTPQEAQIARLAQDGFSNPEIGAQLFISPRTVQYHLRKVFLKLGVTSRNQLGRLPAGRLQSA